MNDVMRVRSKDVELCYVFVTFLRYPYGLQVQFPHVRGGFGQDIGDVGEGPCGPEG